MSVRVLFLGIVLIAGVACGAVLAARSVPAPTHHVEKILSNDRFLK